MNTAEVDQGARVAPCGRWSQSQVVKRGASAFSRLGRAGVKVRTLFAPYVHAKVLITPQTAFLGSQNLSSVSLQDNREMGMLVNGTARTALAAWFQHWWDQSTPWTAAPAASLHISSGPHSIIRIIAPLVANWRVHGHGAPPLGGTRPHLRDYLSRTGPNRMDVSHGHRLFCPPASRRGQRPLALSGQPLAFSLPVPRAVKERPGGDRSHSQMEAVHSAR